MTVEELIKTLQSFDNDLPVAIPGCDFSNCDTCGFHEGYFQDIIALKLIEADDIGHHEDVEKVLHVELRGIE